MSRLLLLPAQLTAQITRCRFRHLSDLYGQFKSSCCLRTGNHGLNTLAATFHKRTEFAPKRLIFFDFDGFTSNHSIDQAKYLPALLLVIQRKIGIFLKDSYFPHFFGAHAACSNVCDAPALKANSGIRDIFPLAENRDSHGVDTLHGRPDKVQNDLQIMNHEVKNNSDFNTSKWIG